ncbi:hypothetical protein GGR57DRAFT_504162 [Xylariaceae sp. FL1272]|nr:hypothetical protein GGR57DRAFT_504162 [Xylariaceae sp. FL1272]
MRTLYEILGVPLDAMKQEIDAALHEHLFSPEYDPGGVSVEVAEAHHVLSYKFTRAIHNRELFFLTHVKAHHPGAFTPANRQEADERDSPATEKGEPDELKDTEDFEMRFQRAVYYLDELWDIDVVGHERHCEEVLEAISHVAGKWHAFRNRRLRPFQKSGKPYTYPQKFAVWCELVAFRSCVYRIEDYLASLTQSRDHILQQVPDAVDMYLSRKDGSDRMIRECKNVEKYLEWRTFAYDADGQ